MRDGFFNGRYEEALVWAERCVRGEQRGFADSISMVAASAALSDGTRPMGASALIYAAPFQIKGAIGSRWLAMALASLKVNLPPNNARLVITPEMPGR